MVPVAVSVWVTALLMSKAFPHGPLAAGMAVETIRRAMPVLAVAVTVIAIGIIASLPLLNDWKRHICNWVLRLLPSVMAVVAGSVITIIACFVSIMGAQAGNPLTNAAYSHLSRVSVDSIIVIDQPWQRSARMGYDFMARCTLVSVRHNGVEAFAQLAVRLFVQGDVSNLERGGSYAMSGMLERSGWNDDEPWISATIESGQVDDASSMDKAAGHDDTHGTDTSAISEGPIAVRSPPLHWRAVDAMHRSFARVVGGLSDQGRLLVTGLTLGTDTEMQLGISEDDDIPPIDENYVQRSKDQFKAAGIIHLMAVSGSHFMLIPMICRWVRAIFRLPRSVIALVHGCFAIALSGMVFPSDSVLRAASTTAGIGSLTMLVGRRGQSVHQLCVVIAFALIVHPPLARSYGFALSCAAVLGIGLWSGRLTAWLRSVMPLGMAEAIAVTVSAQALTLPIQVLLQPEITVLSIPANLVVAPFTAVATICGLLALLVSWCAPQLGWPLVWMASCATAIIDRCAAMFAEIEWSTLPWARGIPGAAFVLFAEVIFVACFVGVRRFIVAFRRTRNPVEWEFGELHGVHHEASRLDSMRLWWASTMSLIDLHGSPGLSRSRGVNTFRAKHDVQR
ncbi:ComEC/Rec2 family competence protein [Bifidobacterium sp.]|uniref:ComEC/Rec2 family competence protein n=1 Tax=Bifidobacterium sp. TaxID=41200 RepID=UPI0039EAB3F6